MAENSTETDGAGIFPFMDVTVSNDKLKAYINIIASGNKESDLTAEYISESLKNQGIVFGVIQEKIEKVVKLWNGSHNNITNELIAEGVPPEKPSDKLGKLMVKGVTNPEQLAAIYQLKFKHIFEIRKICQVDKITPDKIIMQQPSTVNLSSGTSILGGEILPTITESNEVEVGDGIKFDPRTKVFQTKDVGVVSYIGGKLELIPVIFAGALDLQIDASQMQATAVMYPADNGESPLTEISIMEALKSNMVKTGIDVNVIKSSLAECIRENRSVEVVIAQGKPPVPGEDAQINYLLDFAPSLKPEIGETGHADFKNVSLIKSVEPGQKLCEYIPPSRGTPGVNLLGATLPAPDGKDRRLPMGKNTENSKENPHIMVASVSGNAKINQNLVEVTECYVVNKHVDFSTGNINYPKTVHVKGDIKSGFELDVGGDLEVNGIVEDSKINCGGNVLVRAGFIGTGEGQMEVKGNVGLGFARNQGVRCRKSINIAGEAINCKLYARNSIEVSGKKLGIVGGSATARLEIICESAGNESGTKTNLEVGLDFALVEELGKTDDKMKELAASKIKIDTHLAKIVHIKKLKKTLPPKDAMLLKKLVEMQQKVKRQLGALEERKNLIKEKLSKVDQAKVTVKTKVFSGVTIKIGENYLTIDKDLTGPKSFIVKGDGVKVL